MAMVPPGWKDAFMENIAQLEENMANLQEFEQEVEVDEEVEAEVEKKKAQVAFGRRFGDLEMEKIALSNQRPDGSFRRIYGL